MLWNCLYYMRVRFCVREQHTGLGVLKAVPFLGDLLSVRSFGKVKPY